MSQGGFRRGRVLLASASARRTRLLSEAGIDHEVVRTEVDDGELSSGAVSPAAWVTALAYLKARAGIDGAAAGDVVVGADTVCVMDGRVIGQPRDAAEAEAMIGGFVGREHEVVTGVCVLGESGRRRLLRHERARVWLGSLTDAEVRRYVESGEWRGKAGGYNFTQRREAGWPLGVEGAEDTVVGLPVGLVRRMLEQMDAAGAGVV